ncbi:hypothetical protein OG897_38280 [Streptomyces sp. NBC_00237]|uniref:hypothetical protein n=1 Tax=Streptomyces sp. NBC_00237 TaxID=2975687 RepID=UPI00224CBE82|nr:hypothetical protein [Streptomyces sp. NBC_00237]MCX5207239.1 hypothetical protein [Streptomyces sp. NBC_00237]
MVSSSHEAMHRIFEAAPALIPSTLELLGVPLPGPVKITVLPTDATEPRPLERRMDSLLRLDPEDEGSLLHIDTGTPESSFLLVIEAQGKPDHDKPAAWAYYLAYLYTKYKIQPILLVTCQDRTTGRWAEEKFDIGLPQRPSLTLRPLSLGPHNVPAITDPETASEDVRRAVLSTITHGKDPNVGAILKALATALKTVDEDTASTYIEYTEQSLGSTPAAQIWRDLMAADLSYFRSETAQKLRREGKAEGLAEGEAKGIVKGEAKGIALGRAQALMYLLDAREPAVSDEVRDRVLGCTDADVLGRWIKRAAAGTSTDDLFDEA